MFSGFGDSFRKDDTKEDLLGYDDTAFHYFAISVLSCIAVPWTLSIVQSILLGHWAQDPSFPAKSTTTGREMRHPRTAAMVTKIDEARAETKRCTTGATITWIVRIGVLVTM